jgi:beta-1,2-mannosyltransferase
LYLSGFSSDGDVEQMGCDDLRQTGYLDIERSILLHDNISQIALSVSSHPMIQDILGQAAHNLEIFEPQDLIGSRLSQFAGSGVWLSQLNVYIVVSRVVYTTSGTSWPTISFLRGRIFDKDWRHLENYTIDWYGKKTTFRCYSRYRQYGGRMEASLALRIHASS